MTVAEFIEYLKTQDQTLPVSYRCFSEQLLLETKQIDIALCCEARDDGWIQNARPDKPQVKYLLLPGN